MTHLDLSFAQLSGTLPPDVALMSSINFLSLSNNSLSGPVPSALGGLAAAGVLTSLALDGNAFSGALDPRLLNLLGLCSSASVARSFGSPGLAYTCPGSSNSSSPTSNSPSDASAVIGGAVGGVLGGTLLLSLLLVVVLWRLRQRQVAHGSSSSSGPGGGSLELVATGDGKSSASPPREPSQEASGKGGSGIRVGASLGGNTSASGALISPAKEAAGAWQCGRHHCTLHDIYLW